VSFAPLYAAGGAMGWPPSEVRAASLWQLRAAYEGWADANGVERGMDDETFDALAAMVDGETG